MFHDVPALLAVAVALNVEYWAIRGVAKIALRRLTDDRYPCECCQFWVYGFEARFFDGFIVCQSCFEAFEPSGKEG